jgi:hypothetical protein
MSDGEIPPEVRKAKKATDAAQKQRDRLAERHRRLAAALKSNLQRRRRRKTETSG